MRRMTVVLTAIPLLLVAGGAATIACRGGADGFGDAGTDGNIMGSIASGGLKRGSDAGSGDACAAALVTIDDSFATEGASSGGPGCTKDDECTVRMAGDYCACPDTPRPMLASRAASFDEGLNGITKQCTCLIAPCEPRTLPRAACRDGRCILADSGE